MKITIAPSEDQATQSFPYYSVTVESHDDDSFTTEQAVSMFHLCMLSFGFDKDQAAKAMQDFKL